VALVVHFVFYARYALSAVRYPFELDYGEGIIWQQALLIPSDRMYGDITRFPFLVFHYPPLYHIVIRGLAALGCEMLVAGRSLSVVCAILTGVLVAALTHDVTGPGNVRAVRLTGSAVAGLTVFCCWPVVFWSPYMRVDMMATMLSCLGVWFAGRSSRRPWLLWVAVLSLVCAVYTKQTSIAAPLAIMLVFIRADRRRTLNAFGFGLIVGLTAFLVLNWTTNEGFVRHLLIYNLNRISLWLAVSSLSQQAAGHAVFLAMTVGGLLVGSRALAGREDDKHPVSSRSRTDQRGAARLMAVLMLYLAFTTFMLSALGKSGAALNYFIEWMCVGSIMIGVLVVSSLSHVFADDREPTAKRRPALSALLIPAALLVQITILPAGWDFGGGDRERLAQLDALVVRINAARLPVLSDDMVLLLRAGKQVPWEPAIFAELAGTGRWDEQHALDMIAKRAFAFVITEGNPGDLIYDSRFSPAMDRAIRESYPRIEHQGGRTLHLPPA
jgi:hypothetical protein